MYKRPKTSSRLSRRRRGNVNCCRLESLERREMLAGDLAAGDTNGDYYFDEADFVMAMKSGKWETGEAAVWADGDWNGDAEFNSSDFVAAFVNGLYLTGAYDEDAGIPQHELTPLSDSGEADVTLFYQPDSGHLVVHSQAELVAVHVASTSGAFIPRGNQQIFDVASTTSRFALLPPDMQTINFSGALPPGSFSARVDGRPLG